MIAPSTQNAILEAILEPKRAIYLSMARLGIRPSAARAIEASDWRDGWLTISKAAKGGNSNAPIRGTKTGRIQRLPIAEIAHDLEAWLAIHVSPATRLRGRVPLFQNPDAQQRREALAALRSRSSLACRVS